MKFIFAFFLGLFSLGFYKIFAADFITPKEYAKMLYENPRGISCKNCHGESGAEQILGHFIVKGEKKAFLVPSIQNLSFEEFKNSLTEFKDSKSIMPNYSLTDDEIVALYNYIQQEKEKK